MLVQCPKCEFSQPQDQYCARCGIDMVAYKPISTPWYKKIIKSGLFQFVFVLLLGATVAHLVINTNQPQQWAQRINRFRSMTIPQSTQALSAQKEETNSSNTFQLENENTNRDIVEQQAVVIESASQQQVDQLANVNTANQTANTASVKSLSENSQIQNAKSSKFSVRLIMIEIDREFLNRLFLFAQNQNLLLTDSGIKAAVIPDLMSKINIPYKNLKTISNSIDKEEIFSNWSGSSAASEQDTAGLQIDLKAENKDKDLLKVDIKFSKTIFQTSQSMFEFSFETNKKSMLIINGHNLLNDFEFKNQFHNIGPFNIFKSIDFRNAKTEFAILIEVQSQE